MNTKKCFDEGLLKRINPSKAKSRKSLDVAETYILKAQSNFDINNYDIALVCAYTSMFHASRAILFRDGIKERSHICLVSYLEEKYSELSSYSKQMDHYRRARHSVLYGLDTQQTREDAEVAINSVKSFLKMIESLL